MKVSETSKLILDRIASTNKIRDSIAELLEKQVKAKARKDKFPTYDCCGIVIVLIPNYFTGEISVRAHFGVDVLEAMVVKALTDDGYVTNISAKAMDNETFLKTLFGV